MNMCVSLAKPIRTMEKPGAATSSATSRPSGIPKDPTMKQRRLILFLPVLTCVLLAGSSFGPGQNLRTEPSTWRRVATEPILAPSGNSWESAGAFNPAVIRYGNKIVILYRAQDGKGTSRLDYASSEDGGHIMRRGEPVFSPGGAAEE